MSHETRVHRALWHAMIIFSGLCMIAQVVLLIIRLDYHVYISYFIVAIPSWVLALAGVLWGSYMAGVNYLRAHTNQAINGLVVVIMAQGFGWTQFTLARKFEHVMELSYLESLLPLLISVVLASIFLVFIIVMEILADKGLTKKTKD
jgi:hypothetical protein